MTMRARRGDDVSPETAGEAADRDEVWKVLAGREMTKAEIANFHRATGGK